jgi:hypothetical protein
MISVNADFDSGMDMDFGQAAATISWEQDGRQHRGGLFEAPDAPQERYPYDEEALRSFCEVDVHGRKIHLRKGSPLTPIETFVAMTKALHIDLFPTAPGKWVFCRLETALWPPAVELSNISVSIIQTLGTRLTKNRIEHEGDLVGWIYFSSKVSP